MELNLLIAILVILLLGLLFLAYKISTINSASISEDRLKQEIQGQVSELRKDLLQNIQLVNGMVSDNMATNNTNSLQMVEGLGKQLQENQRLATDSQKEQIEQLKEQFATLRQSLNNELQDFRRNILEQVKLLEESNTSQQNLLRNNVKEQMTQFSTQIAQQVQTMETRLEKLEQTNEARLEAMGKSIAEGMKEMRGENAKQLEQIRGTVDEKLQTTLEKRISESFKTVSSQLEQVYKGLGEMQTLATDVGGLKKVLSGVKTRGNLGEYQLAAILREILSPEQYETNVATVPNSRNVVEFAIRLPHEDGIVYLPIDSKFPAETYEQLKDAQESGDRAAVEAAYKRLEAVIKAEANDIRTKYISVPHTTKFAIMFLPVEGLYAEVVSRGMVETLQRDYNINVAGPSTMAALLNSLQMGFKTLALQKKSNRAWEVLGAVKTEFEKFGAGLKAMQKNLLKTNDELEALITTRTNKMNVKLREVEKLDDLTTRSVLELDAPPTKE